MVPPNTTPLHTKGAGYPPAGSFYVLPRVRRSRPRVGRERKGAHPVDSLTPVESARQRAARGAAQAASALSRMLGVGAGGALSGRLALAIDPHILERAGRQLRSILVTGTNGKSTTTALAVAMAAGAVVTNRGANMSFGIAGALARARREATVGVFEVDEAFVPSVAEALRPSVLVWLNLTRDQLDRALEVRRLSERIAEAASSIELVVANALDPIVVLGASRFRRQIWIRPTSTWTDDAHACPRCGGHVSFQDVRWWCEGCSLASPDPDWWIGDDGNAHGPEGVLSLAEAPPGTFNRFNALAAAVAIGALERRPVADVLRGLGRRRLEVEGRFEYWRVLELPGMPRVMTMLAKNPAGFDALVELLAEWDGDVIAQLNAEIADGRDTSWIWDAPWERIAPRRVIVCGRRVEDLALRLEVAGHEPLQAPSLREALRRADASKPIAFVGNYTAFWEANASLRALGAVRDTTLAASASARAVP